MPVYKDYQGKAPVGAPEQPAYAPQAPAQAPAGGSGFDISQPGATEQAYGTYAPQLARPGYGEAFYGSSGGVAGQQAGTRTDQFSQAYNPMANTSQVDTFAQQNQLTGPSQTQQFAQNPNGQAQARDATASGQYWNSVQGRSNVPKDMGAYYDRAREKTAASIDNAAAARGNFNSSYAMGQQAEAAADLGARQAKDEAEYGLQSAELDDRIRGGAASRADSAGATGYGQGLQTAMGADSTGLDRYQAGYQTAMGRDSLGLDRYRTGLAGATAADSAGISRFGAGLEGAGLADRGMTGRLGLLGDFAGAADVSRMGRTDTMFDALRGATGDIQGTVGASYGDMFSTDQGLYDMGENLGLGGEYIAMGGAKDASALRTAGANAMGQGATNTANTVLSAALTKK